MVLTKLHELNFITESELPVLNHICELGHAATGGKHDAANAYQEVKRTYEELLLKGNASPVALAYTSGAVGSYDSGDGGEGSPLWSTRSRAATGRARWLGGVIGGYFGGSGGAAWVQPWEAWSENHRRVLIERDVQEPAATALAPS